MNQLQLYIHSFSLHSFFLILLSSAVYSQLQQCGIPDNNIDLSPIRQTFIQREINAVFRLSICGIVNETICQNKQGMFCHYTALDQFFHLVATASSPLTSWSPLDPNNATAGAILYTANGDICGGTTTQHLAATFIFLCDPSTPVTIGKVIDDNCSYSVNISTMYACGQSSNNNGSKLSGGSIFLIILVVIISLYIVIGVCYNRIKKGTTGIESCPNIDFWKDMSGYIKDGFVFTAEKIRGPCKGSSRPGYDAVK